MTSYDRWKTTTPEDEQDAQEARQDAEKARIERIIDGLETVEDFNFDYDPFNP